MLLQELHIYSEQSSSNTKVSIKNKDGEILFEYCYSNDAIPTFNPIELLRLSLEGDIGVLFQMKTSISQKSKKGGQAQWQNLNPLTNFELILASG